MEIFCSQLDIQMWLLDQRSRKLLQNRKCLVIVKMITRWKKGLFSFYPMSVQSKFSMVKNGQKKEQFWHPQHLSFSKLSLLLDHVFFMLSTNLRNFHFLIHWLLQMVLLFLCFCNWSYHRCRDLEPTYANENSIKVINISQPYPDFINEINIQIHRGLVVKNLDPIILPWETKEDTDADTKVMMINIEYIEEEHWDLNYNWIRSTFSRWHSHFVVVQGKTNYIWTKFVLISKKGEKPLTDFQIYIWYCKNLTYEWIYSHWNSCLLLLEKVMFSTCSLSFNYQVLPNHQL